MPVVSPYNTATQVHDSTLSASTVSRKNNKINIAVLGTLYRVSVVLLW